MEGPILFLCPTWVCVPCVPRIGVVAGIVDDDFLGTPAIITDWICRKSAMLLLNDSHCEWQAKTKQTVKMVGRTREDEEAYQVAWAQGLAVCPRS